MFSTPGKRGSKLSRGDQPASFLSSRRSYKHAGEYHQRLPMVKTVLVSVPSLFFIFINSFVFTKIVSLVVCYTRWVEFGNWLSNAFRRKKRGKEGSGD